MLYNGICLTGFAIALILARLLQRSKNGVQALKILSALMLIWKTAFYINENANGRLRIPVEISALSYFVLPLIILPENRKLYPAGAFFGMLAGFGYFTVYSSVAFSFAESYGVREIILGCLSHGYLLICGLYLFKNHRFESSGESAVWITVLAMLCWGLAFYDVENARYVFIYYVVRPTYLNIFANASLNAAVTALFYGAVVAAFAGLVKGFFLLNRIRFEGRQRGSYVRKKGAVKQ